MRPRERKAVLKLGLSASSKRRVFRRESGRNGRPARRGTALSEDRLTSEGWARLGPWI